MSSFWGVATVFNNNNEKRFLKIIFNIRNKILDCIQIRSILPALAIVESFDLFSIKEFSTRRLLSCFSLVPRNKWRIIHQNKSL